ncbi:bifunctional adenosylcobinamide kinase/adenosylcobinamide-phosphate guanylyltransferase [Paenibacillus filicis]|uniref:Adenosylcobinamide kinase n=1 Tax=Paenibacillus gyeongsangnamensis TaxID=3388067 RepID=A0ABT4QHN5_9BACL|nr:bifunctional adenosylcobinamide kinase/adenosylcobinamide-phosphate guanylyltransferase [Paenibacillus filicis]MCZ8516386.1 bifunctional adenosylcobinamide kinase/adenosylcobinamide-phosphate guanylyltransferase [Paenibacillus filicis]
MKALVTGGARSGKSSFAEAYAAKLAAEGIYIATCQAYDEEMERRIGLHRREREAAGFLWRTVEEPLALAETLLQLEAEHASLRERPGDQGGQRSEQLRALGQEQEPVQEQEQVNEKVQLRMQDGQGTVRKRPVVLVDCLTLWLTNWLLSWEQDPEAERRVEDKIEELAAAVNAYSGPLVLVTNEVGYGLVPEYKLGRQFRDLSGRMNQRLARCADQVFLVASGIPIELKSRSFTL